LRTKHQTDHQKSLSGKKQLEDLELPSNKGPVYYQKIKAKAKYYLGLFESELD